MFYFTKQCREHFNNLKIEGADKVLKTEIGKFLVLSGHNGKVTIGDSEIGLFSDQLVSLDSSLLLCTEMSSLKFDDFEMEDRLGEG